MTPHDTVPLREYLDLKFEAMFDDLGDIKERLGKVEEKVAKTNGMVLKNRGDIESIWEDMKDPNKMPAMTMGQKQFLGSVAWRVSMIIGVVWAAGWAVWEKVLSGKTGG